MYTSYYKAILFILLAGCLVSCKKWVQIDPPRDALTDREIYRAESQAEGALVGIYNYLIHGHDGVTGRLAYREAFGGGLSTIAGGMSAGELNDLEAINTPLFRNNLTYAPSYWRSAYKVIYQANAVIEGLAVSTSASVRDSVKQQYTAEAKLLRAFSYLYLVNFFGDVPLVMTVDFYETKLMARTPQSEVYQQILEDLQEAYEVLPSNYAAGAGQRVRVNKWVAAALLARTHLFLGQYERAAAYASELINQTALFQLEPLDRVFLTDSREAIFQLKQTNQENLLKNATSEGYFFLPNPLHEGIANVSLSAALREAFEPDDARQENWVGSTSQIVLLLFGGDAYEVWYPFKYKTGIANSDLGTPQSEYYMVIRLAEMYLIRAEARAHGADGGPAAAIADLNVIRFRASLPGLPLTLGTEEVLEAVWQERQVELFAEWGHRWLDLKRSGKAVEVLSAMPQNQPWEGDWQLLYPIPESEIKANPNLVQNPGYDQVQ